MPQNINTSIVAENISKSFGSKRVLDDLSLSLEPGQVFGLVGLNGAGKTTLIRLLLGLLNPDTGACSVLGYNPSSHDRMYYRRVGVVLEHNGFFGNCTVSENLSFYAQARGVSADALQQYFSEYWADTAIGKDTRKVKVLSRGQKMQCSLCRAFLGWPEVYFFDEPAVALDLEAYDQFCAMVRKAQSGNATIIISSHQLDTIEELCTSVGIMEKGKISLLEDFAGKRYQEQWVIRSDYDVTYKAIIEDVCKSEALYKEDHWEFCVGGDIQKMVSVMVTQLAASGASIFEVTPAKTDFRKSIRKFYDGGAGV